MNPILHYKWHGFLLIISILIGGCQSFFETSDQFADRFVKNIENGNFTEVFFMLSENKRASFDTTEFYEAFNVMAQLEKVGLKISEEQCAKLVKMMKDSATYSYKSPNTDMGNASYTMIINTYDAEAILKATVADMQKTVTLPQIIQLSVMPEAEKFKLVGMKIEEYIENNNTLPRKDIEIPFNIIYEGASYAVE